MSYQITGYDIINGEKTVKRIFKPIEVLSISDIDRYQERKQRLIQRRYKCDISVFVHYKVPIPEHIPHR